MSAVSKFDAMFERILEQKLERKIDEYFASVTVLSKGPVFQVHASMTKSGLTRAAKLTKRSRLADMSKDEKVFEAAPKGVSVNCWESRWCSTRSQMQRKTGYVWRINRDHEKGGVWITRTK